MQKDIELLVLLVCLKRKPDKARKHDELFLKKKQTNKTAWSLYKTIFWLKSAPEEKYSARRRVIFAFISIHNSDILKCGKEANLGESFHSTVKECDKCTLQLAEPYSLFLEWNVLNNRLSKPKAWTLPLFKQTHLTSKRVSWGTV